VYQRNYDWSINECRELLDDAIATEMEKRGTHFIGSIVFIHEGIYTTNEVKELVIIDGQQRLTTINVLFVALYRFAKENQLKNDAERIYNMYIINQYVSQQQNKLKLKQTDANSQAFESIIEGTESIFSAYSNVIENYNYFRSRVNLDNFETIQRGINRLIFVEISLERDKDDPQRIFESLNSTGLALSQSDLIRNFILMDLEPKEQQRVFRQIWNPIEENARDLAKQKSMVSSFIRDFLTLKNKKIPNQDKVYIEFKSQYATRKGEEYEQDLENIKSLSFQYKKLINPFVIKDPTLRREVEYISKLEINVAYPFLLQVFEDHDNGIINQETVISVLQLIQSYTWRRFIVGLPTNALNKIFMSLYTEVDAENYYNSVAVALLKKKASSKFPTNEEVKVGLRDKNIYSTQAKNRNYFFELLENHNNREYVDTSNPVITIEHIFPRTPEEEWRKDISQNDYIAFSEQYLHTIGNLTLSGNNGALGNKSFSKKKTMNDKGGEQGYSFSRLWLNDFLKKIESWDIGNFEYRLELIFDRFIEIWKYPDVAIPMEDSQDEQSIYDAEEPTHKKLEYFIFEDSKIEESAIAQMYYYVLRKLFEKSPQYFLSTEQDIVKVSRSQEEFRTPQELLNGHYIEANIDSRTKFTALKKLLPTFELEDELIIKYAAEDALTAKTSTNKTLFWSELLPELNKVTSQFANISPRNQHWLSSGSGYGGVSFGIEILQKETRISLIISTSSTKTNKLIFNYLYAQRAEIEAELNVKLEWFELPNSKMSYVKLGTTELTLKKDSQWPLMIKWFTTSLPVFIKVLKPRILKLKNETIPMFDDAS
jgi:uncharacterized protein with ParB-like and HNH nuclease domain